MEGLVSNITGACPLAFAGGSGPIFAQAIAALVAAQCALLDNGWPKDRGEQIFRASEVQAYDFVIVGAGTAGSRLASRLSNELPSHSILLVEAGDDPGIESEIPALFFMDQRSKTDWSYKTQPDAHSCKGCNNDECVWSKGKAMGGSGSVNAMLYLRGHPADYENWNTDNTNWGYQDLVPYYENIERIFNVSSHNNNHVLEPVYDLLRKSWNELGYGQSDDDGANEATIGTRKSSLLIQNGRRLNTAKVSLQSTSQNSNLDVIKKTTVQRVIVDAETRTVKNVEVMNENGERKHITARKEVILSAGSIATPQILMASGIGPNDANLDLKNIITLPVGKNLQDHVLLPLFLQFDKDHSTEVPTENRIQAIVEYLLFKTGQLSNIGLTDFMSFVSTKNEPVPDVQFHHLLYTKDDDFILKTYLNGVGYKDTIAEEIYRLNKKNNLLGIFPTLLHPKSRGEILLKAKDPTTKPVIKANYFHHPEDMATMLRAVRLVQNLAKTSQFQEFGITLPLLRIDACLEHPEDSTSYWQCYIQHMATTIYHPVGTAKMGRNENDSVVDSNLLVHGTKNLRVVDASVMPSITGGNTVAPTLVIAEKAADIIRNYYKVNDEL